MKYIKFKLIDFEDNAQYNSKANDTENSKIERKSRPRAKNNPDPGLD